MDESYFMKKIVAVAMSGGVDSSCALLKLKEEGYDVFGLTLKLFCYAEEELTPKSCCSLEAINHARNICMSVGVSHMVVDVSEIFAGEVIDYFVNSYIEGFTPNPCVVCNRKIKWGYLLQKALSSGADYLATGHYAKTFYCEERKRHILSCGLDSGKEQSYYLWQLSQDQLEKTLFPLGEMTKKEVKEKIKDYDLKIAEKPESQEICFIPHNDYKVFLKEKYNIKNIPGNILDSSGRIIGRHEGYPFYTIGQRRGLGVATGERLYVKSINPLKNEVILGAVEELYKKEVIFSQANFIAYPSPPENKTFKARIRYRGKLQDCKLKAMGDGKFLLNFSEPVWGVCPGQSVVIYEDQVVVGGGIIIL